MVAITIARGDGIGPEIMDATLHVLQQTGANLEFEEVQIGEAVYKAGHSTGIEPATWDSLRRTRVFLKAPITTPQGGGFKSLNVTVRTSFGLYANVRPCVAYHPYVDTKHPGMDVVVVRENEEDLYAGIEYRQTPDTYTSLKLISRPGSEKIVRYAFEYARANGRKKVTCFTKDNIMKLSDGEFHRVYEQIAKEYPEIETEHWIVDIGAAKLADSPQNFDVLVLPNLYGDILSDVGAQIAGSVGLVGSANIGAHGAMFEAIHGSAPRRAGQNLANPSGLMLAAVQMLVHVGETAAANAFHNAWLRTLEEGIHTYDIFKEGVSAQKVGTHEFGQAVADRLGQRPEKLKPADYKSQPSLSAQPAEADRVKKELIGVDITVEWHDSLEALRAKLEGTPLAMIANRGARLWPEGVPETFCIDQWRLRFHKPGMSPIELQHTLAERGLEIVKTDNLYTFDGTPAFSGGHEL